MIIWGWRTVFRIVGSGVFSCPSCGADRNYQRRKAQRFFTLFFIPLIPLNTIGEFIRCTYCNNDFRESVLARPTAAQFTDLLQNTVRGVMVHVLRAGGWDHPGARAAAAHEIASAGAAGYGEPNLAQDMQVVPQDLSQMLAALAGQLPEAGREALLTGAVRVAVVDGPVQPAERAVIDSVGAALGMSQAYVSGIVAAVAPGAVIAAQPQAPAWGEAAEAPAPASAPAQASAKETMLIQAPQPAPASGGSGMETMLIQAPQPAPATGAHDAVPPQAPASGGSGMETMLIQAPQPAPATGAHDAVPPQQPTPSSSSMETVVVPIQAPQQTVPTPPPTMVDTSASMQTMALPIPPQAQPQSQSQSQPQQPANPAEDPAAGQPRVNWPPQQQ